MTIYCENCNQKHEGTYGSGRFCSKRCASSFSTKDKRKEINAKVSKSLSGRPSPIKGRQIKEKQIRGRPKKERFIGNCIICGSQVELFDVTKRTTCKSIECIHKQKSLAGKKSASKRKRRSKDEMKLHKLCERYYHNVFHNIPVANGWDADIILPDYNIAIMWNGPWHYRDMNMKNHSLAQVVNRDIIKIIEFEKIGWDVLIYEDNQWTPETAFIDIILKLSRDKGI